MTNSTTLLDQAADAVEFAEFVFVEDMALELVGGGTVINHL